MILGEVDELRSVRALAVALAAWLAVSGCQFVGRPDPLVAQVTALAGDSGATRIAAVTITSNSDDTAVLLYLPGEMRWVGASGADLADQADVGQPRGGMTPDRLPGEALRNQLNTLIAQCDDHPEVRAFVGLTGAVIGESWCGVGAGRRVVNTTIDGLTQEGPGLDLTRAEGIDALLTEVMAAVPDESAYEVIISGPVSGPTVTSTTQAGVWILPDGTACQVAYHRDAKPEAGKPLRWYTCDGVGARVTMDSVGFEVRESLFEISDISGAGVETALKEGLAKQGVTLQQVEFYGAVRLSTMGSVLGIQMNGQVHLQPM